MGSSSASRKQGTVVHDFNSSILDRKEDPQLQNEFKDTLGCMKQHLGEKVNIYLSSSQVGWSLLCRLIEVCPGTLLSLIGPQDIGNDWEVLGIHR